MITLISTIYKIGNIIGHYTNIIFVLIMAVGCIYCMRKYLN
jgi:hypothetical protein